ncbi:hypothetical protein vseg_013819 [Gypsophila vaccaria]
MDDKQHKHKHKHNQKPSHFNFTNHNNISIFPPINHEDLPIPPPPQPPPSPPPPPPQPPLTINSDDHPSPPKKNKKNYAHLISWVSFALHYWLSKFVPFFRRCISCVGLVSFSRYVAVTAAVLGAGWCWFRCRRRYRVNDGREESVEHLKAIIKSKDEKILQLLEQIAHMNKVLLAHYKIPALKTS